jgi:glycosyltransferase involved in cell wall biosynthesis
MCKYLYLFLIIVFPLRYLRSEQSDFSLLIVATFNAKYQGLTGVDTYVRNYTKALRNAGYKVCVAVEENSGLHKRLLEDEMPCVAYRFQQAKLGRNLSAVTQFLKNLASVHGFTHVHCNWDKELPFVYKALGDTGIKFYCTHHYQTKMPIDKFPFLSGVVVVNKQLAAEHNINSVPVVFIPPFIDEQRFLSYAESKNNSVHAQYYCQKPVVTMIGNMYNDDSFKNHPLFINAFELLKNKYNFPCTALLVGGGTQKEFFERMVVSKNLSQDIHFLGLRRDIPAIIQASDVVVLTSKVEGFGMVLAEANFMGKPVVGPSDSGVEGAIEDGVNGFLFRNGDIEDYCTKVMTLLGDWQLRESMGRMAKKYALEHFTEEILLAKMMRLYHY